ncbi:hypothetical protein LENED_001479 [Lentinula edodes]|uniref:Secreted protein n=1 Tax=Lentinula edodes TaxID=5353 RepID=A0A1Q3DYH6_LENED|nr:hypothetical protein LENED_001479 [Lentinula edodes]
MHAVVGRPPVAIALSLVASLVPVRCVLSPSSFPAPVAVYDIPARPCFNNAECGMRLRRLSWGVGDEPLEDESPTAGGSKLPDEAAGRVAGSMEPV